MTGPRHSNTGMLLGLRHEPGRREPSDNAQGPTARVWFRCGLHLQVAPAPFEFPRPEATRIQVHNACSRQRNSLCLVEASGSTGLAPVVALPVRT